MVQTRSKSKSVVDISTSGVDCMQQQRSAHSSRTIQATPDGQNSSASAPSSSASPHPGLPQRPVFDDDNATTTKNESVRSISSTEECTQSSHSSATVRAKKLAIEAEHLRRRVQLAQQQAEREAERERLLARLQLDAEQSELQAKLAALDASDKSSRRSSRTSRGTAKRTESWVMNIDVDLAEIVQPAPMPELPLTSVVQPPPPLPSVPLNITQDTQARSVRSATVAQPGPAIAISSNPHDPTIKGQPPMNHSRADSTSQLAKAIYSLAERPKRPELIPFSGDLGQWMSFKTTYDKTKHLFSPAENLTRLNNAVRGPAYQAVASHLWGSSDPEHVMSTLEQNFARPEILVAREIAGLRNIKISNVEHLNNLANKLRNCVSTIKYLQQYESLYSPELFRTVLTKLSEHTRSRFTDYAATHVMSFGQNMPKLEMLSEFLLIEADRQLKFNFTSDLITAPSSNKFTLVKPTFPTYNKPKPLATETIHATIGKNNTIQCVYCKQGVHIINKCKAFNQLNIESRWQWIREHSVCYRCLRSHPHRWNFCRAKPCGTDGCTRRHHALLHGASESTSRTNDHPHTVTPGTNNIASKGIVATTILDTGSSDDNSNIQVANLSESPFITTRSQPRSTIRGLLKVLPVVLEGPTGQFATTALLDEGSTATLIDSDVAARIGAKSSRKDHLRIEGVSGMSTDVNVSYVDFHIRGRNLKDCYLIQNARAITPLGLRTQNFGKINFSDFAHLADLSDELSYEHTNPTVLIGAGDWYLSVSREVRAGKKNQPVASRTLLGWVLHGAISTTSKPVDFVHHTAVDNIETCARSKYDELERLIKFQYEIDAIGIKKFTLQSDDEKRAIEMIESTARRLSDSRFEVGLPWKQDLPKIIPDSYPQALSRLKALERQMSKDKEFASAFRRFLDDIMSKGYAEKCDVTTYHKNACSGTSTAGSDSTIRWYLPIFGVYHPQKRKLRAVHDAAAKTKGVCLNNLLLQGPDLLQPLLDILFRFREGAVALNADIREMFPQIKIAPKDRDAQRFLWRNDDGTIGEYRMASMIFGAVSSPFIAQYLKNKNAKELETTYPEACNAILHDHYMDDYLGSHSSVTEAARIAADILAVHKNCCYEMRSWTSNEPKALCLIPKEFRSQPNSEVHLPPNNSEVGVLGVRWNPLEDSLSFRTLASFPSGTLTKRIVLSNVMKVYDPLGFLTPISIRGRILIQKLWREGTDWDAPLPDTYATESRNWFQQLQKAATIRIPRWYLTKSDPIDTQLHVLADGGEQAYACVAYWRFAYEDGSISVALIGSKARVTPLKPISIPRLELQAALIACRLARTILNAHRIKPSAVFYWTDSTTVLKWIRSDARSFKPFVAHRLGEILELTNPSNWRWVPSLLNIADDATKPKTFDFNISHRWFSGPAFLLQPDCDWPVEVTSDMEEVTPAADVESELVGFLIDAATINTSIPEFSRFSKWLRLLRTTARVLQAARIFRSFLAKPLTQDSIFYTDGTTSSSELSATDMARAELLLLRRAQVDQFSEEVKLLQSSQPVPKSSKIAALHPVLDSDGLIKLDSRINAAPGVSESAKRPIVLDGRHHIVRLMIMHYHRKMAHSFNELVLNELRQKFWILKARSIIRNVSNTCLECRRHKARPSVPRTGDLPLQRVEHHTRPFTNVGLDYFGPVDVTVLRHHEKRYVALYTCLVTRAIHLEVVGTLSTDSALLSLRRFIARRGSPSVIFSDNGTNFVGASRVLKSLHGDDVREFATNHKIEWRFIPPASPFMGGVWERLVRTVKSALKNTLKSRAPKEEVLTTLLMEAESIINSRPLTYVPSSLEVPESITPFHFILGSSSAAPWTSSLTDADLIRRCDWRSTLRLADHFWARWLQEYLPTLRPRGRSSNSQNLAEGDVVLIADSSLPRGLWPLGRITKTFMGADGTVRVADVLTKGGTLRRPVRKLLLMTSDDQPLTT